jgi:hypothetical protein
MLVEAVSVITSVHAGDAGADLGSLRKLDVYPQETEGKETLI